MLPLQEKMLNRNLERRLTPAEKPPRSLKRSKGNKAAQTARFAIRSLFQQLTFSLRIIREHFLPQRFSGSAPRWDVGVAFRHRKTMVPLTLGHSATNASLVLSLTGNHPKARIHLSLIPDNLRFHVQGALVRT
jgi:hypothetical protein